MSGSYDFVHHRTDDGRAFRMLNVLDEFTRESLAIRVRRKLSSTDVIDVLTDLFILRGIPAWIRSDNGPEFVAEAVRRWITAVGGSNRFHRAGLALGEWLHRELQCPTARRVPERGDLLHPQGSPGSHRVLAVPLQRDPPTWQPGIPAAGPGDGSSCQAGRPAPLRSAGHPAWLRNPQCTNIRTGPVDGGRSGPGALGVARLVGRAERAYLSVAGDPGICLDLDDGAVESVHRKCRPSIRSVPDGQVDLVDPDCP